MTVPVVLYAANIGDIGKTKRLQYFFSHNCTTACATVNEYGLIFIKMLMGKQWQHS